MRQTLRTSTVRRRSGISLAALLVTAQVALAGSVSDRTSAAAFTSYEAALTQAIDAYRSGGSGLVVAEVSACFGGLQAVTKRIERLQYCYLLGDASVEVMRSSGDTSPSPPLLHEPSRRQTALTALLREGLDPVTGGELLSLWSVLGRQALAVHGADLATLKPTASTPKDAR